MRDRKLRFGIETRSTQTMPKNKPLTFTRFESDKEVIERILKEDKDRGGQNLPPRPPRTAKESVQDYLDRISVQRRIVWDDE